MTERMAQTLQKMQAMSSEELEVFLSEGFERASEVLSREYQYVMGFKIVGEEVLHKE